MKVNDVLLIHDNTALYEMVSESLSGIASIMQNDNIRKLPYMLRADNFVCVIIHANDITPSDISYIKYERDKFSYMPWIILMNEPDVEAARLFGSCGIDQVVLARDMDVLRDCVSDIVSHKRVNVTFKELDVDIDDVSYSQLLRDALMIMEDGYTHIMKVNTIADIIKVSEATVTREFQRFEFPGPKRILMILKVTHAIKLMSNNRLIMSEIASLSGFSDIKRMTECFQRIYNMSPGKFKSKFIENNKKSMTANATRSGQIIKSVSEKELV